MYYFDPNKELRLFICHQDGMTYPIYSTSYPGKGMLKGRINPIDHIEFLYLFLEEFHSDKKHPKKISFSNNTKTIDILRRMKYFILYDYTIDPSPKDPHFAQLYLPKKLSDQQKEVLINLKENLKYYETIDTDIYLTKEPSFSNYKELLKQLILEKEERL